jgi:hypothetical protein
MPGCDDSKGMMLVWETLAELSRSASWSGFVGAIGRTVLETHCAPAPSWCESTNPCSTFVRRTMRSLSGHRAAFEINLLRSFRRVHHGSGFRKVWTISESIGHMKLYRRDFSIVRKVFAHFIADAA